MLSDLTSLIGKCALSSRVILVPLLVGVRLVRFLRRIVILDLLLTFLLVGSFHFTMNIL